MEPIIDKDQNVGVKLMFDGRAGGSRVEGIVILALFVFFVLLDICGVAVGGG